MLELRVKPVTLLKKAVAPISMISIEATINYYPEGISLQATDENVRVLAILRIDASSLDYFRCNVDGEGGIDPKALYLVLDSRDDDEEEEWSVTINGNDHDTAIGFVFQNATEGVSQNYQMKFLKEIPPSAGFDELNYECQAVVGIPSAEFRRIMMHLKLFGMLVKVYITDTRVKLSTMNEEIVLRKENGECTIDGAVDEPIKFSFGLQKLASFLNASVLTSTVSILAPVSCDKPCILDCPIESLGVLVHDIKIAAARFAVVSFSLVQRDGNNVAHSLCGEIVDYPVKGLEIVCSSLYFAITLLAGLAWIKINFPSKKWHAYYHHRHKIY